MIRALKELIDGMSNHTDMLDSFNDLSQKIINGVRKSLVG